MFIFLLPLLSWAGVVQDDVATTDKIFFSFQQVCQKMVSHESPLIEIVSGSQLDCMGKKIEVGKFCEKAAAQDPYYLRAYVDKEQKKVVCHSGKKVLFKYQCITLKDHRLCRSSAKASCLQIKEKLAKRLDMVHSSVTENEKGIKELNCYFESLPLKEKSIGSL